MPMFRYADYDIRDYPIQCYRLRRDGTYKVSARTVTGWVHKQAPWLGFHGVEGEETCYTVTHLPSGKAIATLPTQAAGRELIGSLATLPDLACSSPPSGVGSEVQAMISSLSTRLAGAATPSPRLRSGKKPGTVPSSFSPVYPPGVVPTPKTRIAMNEAAIALGQAFSASPRTTDVFALTAGAASVLRREEIVVRVTQPPRAILLEGDIPNLPGESSDSPPSTTPRSSRPSSTPSLRDGTPATPAEFRRRYQILLDLGDRLRAGSLAFSKVYAEGEREGWTVARLEKWEVMDRRFREIVGEGWLVWSGAAFCYDAAPAMFQANVVLKLGYIGDRAHGYHELGIKTLLRHPEIAEVQPLRREMRERIWREL